MVTLDDKHNFECVICHNGSNQAGSMDEAHSGLIHTPAHPQSMKKTCGPCHENQVTLARQSLHFTLHNEVNQVRQAFGAKEKLPSLLAIPSTEVPSSPLELVDDLLRRRCLRCHVYYQGDSYQETIHGIGCAACHLHYEGGKIQSHAFVKYPDDNQCLHCHYGNHVGSDYYGRYEHDFKWEYRTPYPNDGSYPDRPYGVEFHQLAPDIHQTRGIACIDCHPGSQLKQSGGHKKTTCETCHMWKNGSEPFLNNLVIEKDTLFLISKLDGKKHLVPVLKHPAHKTYGKKAACTVCHAQWSYNDKGSHLMRHDLADYAPWTYLSIQGSSEVEQLLETSYAYDEELPPIMTDKISGETRPGIWYKGFELRRWEAPLIGKDTDGKLKIFRPILDLHLSYVNQEEDVVFDSITSNDLQKGLRPYTPHTTGKAGTYYRQRLQENITPMAGPKL